ncbi:MAG: NUDIX domain-containing protein [Dehalococcoidia bacterium]
MICLTPMLQDDKFCAECATPLILREEAGQPRPVCPNCGRVVYYDPKIAATAVVERESKVLMIRRAVDNGYGLWSIPGGYVDRGEVVEEAAAREVREETGLIVQVEQLVGLFSEPGEIVVVAAFSALEIGGKLEAGTEALDLGFFAIDELPPLAFPRDKLILARWLAMMRSGV